VIALLERHGGRMVEVEPNHDAGSEYESFLYAVTLVEGHRTMSYPRPDGQGWF
jgi:hypothetical protein